MKTVTVRELRNHGGRVLDRVAAGEHIIVTRDGTPVAELRPVRRPLDIETLVARRQHLPPMDPSALRRDIDEILDMRL